MPIRPMGTPAPENPETPTRGNVATACLCMGKTHHHTVRRGQAAFRVRSHPMDSVGTHRQAVMNLLGSFGSMLMSGGRIHRTPLTVRVPQPSQSAYSPEGVRTF